MSEITVKIARSEMKEIKRGVAEESAIKLMHELGDTAYVLYQFYVSRSYLDNQTFEDEDAIKHLGWSRDKVERTRRKLTKSHWIYRESGVYSSGRKLLTIYLGKKNVLKVLGIRELAPWELRSIQTRTRKELNIPDDDVWAKDKTLAAQVKKLFKKYRADMEQTPEPVNRSKAMRDELEELREVS
jgi:hypothetical protein